MLSEWEQALHRASSAVSVSYLQLHTPFGQLSQHMLFFSWNVLVLYPFSCLFTWLTKSINVLHLVSYQESDETLFALGSCIDVACCYLLLSPFCGRSSQASKF